MYDNIEAERARARKTRTELAEDIGVSLPTYTAYVSGKRPIPSDVLLSLSSQLDCSIDYLLGLTERRQPYE